MFDVYITKSGKFYSYSKILSDDDAKVISALGNGTFPKDGFKIKIKDGVVVTVLGENE